MIRLCLSAFLLIAMLFSYILAVAMIIGFFSWLAMTTLKCCLPYIFFFQIGKWPVIIGLAGAIYVLVTNTEFKFAVGGSLWRTVDFINRFFPAPSKEVKNG